MMVHKINREVDWLVDDNENVVGYRKSNQSEKSIVTAETNGVTGGIINTVWTGSQAQYDALAVKDANTLYSVTA